MRLLRRRTARQRLTILYCAMFVVTGRLRPELDRVDRLLDGFLMLARAQHGDLPEAAHVSLEAVTAASLAARAGAVSARGLTVRHDPAEGGAWVHGNQALLGRMVDNVLDNAIIHNTAGGWIQIGASARGESAHLVVETGGDVLDQAMVDQLVQPFRRLVADRTGSDGGAGLGLSIVAAIAAAHHGRLNLQARDSGGLRVNIELPLATR